MASSPNMVRFIAFLGTSALFWAVVPSTEATPASWTDGRNLIPNGTFAGSDGLLSGAATGTVPDCWRGFAIAPGASEISLVPLAANVLYSGSPATNAVKLRVTSFGTDQGFDHDNAQFLIVPNQSYHVEFYVKTGNVNNASQHFNVSFPLFEDGVYLQREPGGTGTLTATSSWTKIVGPTFSDAQADSAHVGFRVTSDGGENAILIALPVVAAPASGYGFAPHTACELAGRPTWTAADKLIGTTYFYWYRWSDHHFFDNSQHTDDALTDHFVSPETVSMTSKAWHKKEASDMIDAGIDMLWPVYWAAPGNFDLPGWTLFVEGLLPLQDALDELAAEGRLPPRVAMFYDTSSLLNSVRNTSPPDGKADLTTPEGREIFYQTIRSFFCTIHPRHWACIDGRPIVVLYAAGFAADYDQSCITYVNQRFADEFDGIAPYIIRELSWQVQTDSSYRWGGALTGPWFDGIVAMGAGYDDTAVNDRTTPFRLREDGNYYRWSWLQVLQSSLKIVHLETWNEMHEGTDLCETMEYGRQYIDLTALYAAHFKAGTIPEESITLQFPDIVPRPADLEQGIQYAGTRHVLIFASGGLMVEKGIDYVPSAEGTLTAVTDAGTTWLRTEAAGDRYVYFNIKDPFYFNQHRVVEVSVEYRDTGTGPVTLYYDSFDSAQGAYTPAQPFTLQNTGQILTHTWQLDDARFANRQSGGADFRLHIQTGPLYIRRIQVRLLSQAVPFLRVASVSPVPDSAWALASSTIVATFTADPLPASVNAGTFLLTRSGGDRVFDNGNDVAIAAESIGTAGNQGVFTPVPGSLPDDLYRIRLVASGESPIVDTQGHWLDGAFTGAFPSGDGLGGTDFLSTFSINRRMTDLDRDGDTDGPDFLLFSTCYNGSNRPPYGACYSTRADFDGDTDIDGFDFLTFSNCFNGSNRPPACP